MVGDRACAVLWGATTFECSVALRFCAGMRRLSCAAVICETPECFALSGINKEILYFTERVVQLSNKQRMAKVYLQSGGALLARAVWTLHPLIKAPTSPFRV